MSVYMKIIFSYFSTKTYVGTQKNHLIETVLLSTQNICLNWILLIGTYVNEIKKYLNHQHSMESYL